MNDPRKVFLSFLGTSNYIEVSYKPDNKPALEPTRFIQEALLKDIASQWSDRDIAYIFLTDDARRNNWLDNGHDHNQIKENIEKIGLKSRLQQLQISGYRLHIEEVSIPEGFSKEEIWKIFDIVYGQLEPNDEIYLDMTHAFRSIPTFAIILLNYAQLLKNVSIKAIHYGAFEKLGPAYKVREIAPIDRIAPIIDLSDFVRLQQWTEAASLFFETGRVEKLVQQTSTDLRPILRKAQGQDHIATAVKILNDNLPKIMDNIRTCRGKDIVSNHDIAQVTMAIGDLEKTSIPAFTPIFHQLRDKLMEFKGSDDQCNGLIAVRWCLDFGMYQQAATLLAETAISIICTKANLDWQLERDRNIVSSSISLLYHNTPECDWKAETAIFPQITQSVLEHPLAQQLNKGLFSLQQLRNDLSHAGIRGNPSKASNLKSQIEALFNTLSPYLSDHANQPI